MHKMLMCTGDHSMNTPVYVYIFIFFWGRGMILPPLVSALRLRVQVGVPSQSAVPQVSHFSTHNTATFLF
jgi:hypothetical protein